MDTINKARILIIGDAENSDLFDHILRRYGDYETKVQAFSQEEYHVIRPTLIIHTNEILQVISSFHPNLIVMSYDSEINEFIEKVHASGEGHGLPIIVIAGRHSWCATADVCLRMPVTPEELVKAAQELLQRSLL